MKPSRARQALDPDAARLPLAGGLLLFVPIALLGNAIGSTLRYPEIGSAVLFPPYAALTAVLVASPRRHWVWYILTGSIAHLTTHWPHWSLSWVLLADVANVMRALTAAVALRWVFGGTPRLASIRGLALFVLCAVLIAPAAGAVIGAANVMIHGASDSYWRPWTAWFVSNALTGLAMLPAFLALFAVAGRGRLRIERRSLAEAILLAATLGATCAIAFLQGSFDRRYLVLLLYTPLPALIWAALRFGSGGASLALSAVAFAAIWSVDHGTGPFPAPSLDDNILALQIFVLLTTVPILCLAVIASARDSLVQLYHALLASTQDQVAILDGRGVVLEVNESWRRSADEAGGPLFHRVRPGDDYVAACRVATDQGDSTAASVLTGVTNVLNRAPACFEVEYAIDSLREAYVTRVEALERSEGGAVVTRANVTARRRAQQEIEEQRREVSHLARVAVLGQLSGALAHELHQPLTSILGNAEAARHMLRRQPVDLDELSAILGDIVDDDQRAADVINRLRALLKRGDTQRQPLEVRTLIDDVLHLARGELITRRVTATAHVAPALPPLIGDRVQLQQLLLNLILNGCEAMTAATNRRLLLRAEAAAAGDVHIVIRDSGPGIPEALLERLFEPFVTTKPEGLGLGLSISRTIVAAHGGRLWAENNPEGGASMHCLLAVTTPGGAAAVPQPLAIAGS